MKTKTLWITTYFDGLDENWLIYASKKDDDEQAEVTFRKLFYREYGVKFQDEITGTSELKMALSLDKKDYAITLKS